jgi:indole-3-glycerol phosphate synthase
MLDEMVAATRRRLATAGVASIEPTSRTAPVGFGASLRRPGLQVIAEIKRRSPSAGDIRPELDPAQQASEYARGGAAAISVLTEPEYFGGSLQDLTAVREAVTLPVLRKDFIVDPRQVEESRAAGADALLLIVAALEPRGLGELLAECARVGITALVEAHDTAEAAVAVAAGAAVIGVNNRNLKTFFTDLAVAEAVAASLPADRVRVAESGVSSAAGAARMAQAGFDAVLVGEALVRAEDPAGLIAELRGVSR